MGDNRILVTGATGFVGRSLCKFLKSSGYQVQPTARRQPSNQSEFNYFLSGNITETTDWTDILSSVDVVIHLAARAHIVNDSSKNPLAKYRLSNTLPTIKLARDAIEAGVRRFIFVSTIGVNGSETFGDPYRACDIAAPHSPYAKSKYEAELRLKSLFQETSSELVILRPPLIYGMDAPGNLASIMGLVKNRRPIPLSRIFNKRSFISIDNFISLLEVCISHPNAADRTLLISDGVDLSTSDFVKLIGALVDKKPLLFWLPPRLTRFCLETIGKKMMAKSLYGDLQVHSQDTFDLLDWTPVFCPKEFLSNW